LRETGAVFGKIHGNPTESPKGKYPREQDGVKMMATANGGRDEKGRADGLGFLCGWSPPHGPTSGKRTGVRLERKKKFKKPSPEVVKKRKSTTVEKL